MKKKPKKQPRIRVSEHTHGLLLKYARDARVSMDVLLWKVLSEGRTLEDVVSVLRSEEIPPW